MSVPVIGNVVADDDYLHPLGPESNFNESMYFAPPTFSPSAPCRIVPHQPRSRFA